MRRHRAAARSLALLAFFLLAALPAAAVELPAYPDRVNDLAGMVDAETETRLEERLAALERSTGAQVVVLTIPALDGEVLEDFSLRVAESWGLGREEQDDGLLFLVARDDRRMRLEVGYGLEGTIPDVIAGRILDGAVRPRFRDGDFAGGIEAGVESIAGAIEGDPGAVPPERVAGGGRDVGDGLMMLLLFFTIIVPFSASAIFTKGCGGWTLFVFLAIFWAVFPFAVLGLPWGLLPVALWVVVGGILRLLLAGSRGDALRTSYPWLVSSGRGGGGGWSSGGGGGFSGGGGSFGGGGASSSW